MPETDISAKSQDIEETNAKQNILNYGMSMREQMSLILKYYDECILKMGQSSTDNVTSLVGQKIDLLIGGQEEFETFRRKLNCEILNGLDHLSGKIDKEDDLDKIMVIDDW